MSCGFVIGSGAQRSGTHSSRKVLRCGLGSEKSDAGRLTRRVFLLGTGSLVLSRVLPSEARVLPKSREDLLSDLKSKKTEEEMEQEKADKAEERRKRLERQKELREAEEKKKLEGKTDAESDIESNLRANYYYPTARKRYLPRIKDCADEIENARKALETDDWAKLKVFLEGPADKATGPLKLYASSLAGQGLSLKVAYVEEMTKLADVFETQLNVLTKAVKAKKKSDALKAFGKLESALSGYRKAARIDTPDGGIGEIPTDKRVGSGFSNLLPRKTN